MVCDVICNISVYNLLTSADGKNRLDCIDTNSVIRYSKYLSEKFFPIARGFRLFRLLIIFFCSKQVNIDPVQTCLNVSSAGLVSAPLCLRA